MHEAGVERFRDNEVVVVAGPHDLLLVLNDEEWYTHLVIGAKASTLPDPPLDLVN